MAPHVGVTSVRAHALHALASGTARVVVASAAALLPRVSAPQHLLSASMNLRPGQDISPTELTELLIDAGFSREDPADEHGEFALRGGILDIFPAGATYPVRLEFMGDTIETLRTYDPGTQRSIAPIDQLTVVPLRDILGDDRSATLLDYVTRARDARIIVSERDEVDANVAKLLEQLRHGYEEALQPSTSSRSSPDVLFADWADVDAKLTQGTVVAELGLDDDARSRFPESKLFESFPATTSAANPLSSCTGASATSLRKSESCAKRAKRRCSSPRHRAGRSARSSC